MLILSGLVHRVVFAVAGFALLLVALASGATMVVGVVCYAAAAGGAGVWAGLT
ncbi:hypothetical protein [Streptomyces sp. NPDC058812]|uniref:hypothetical protein n=1 Tax=unclassified Streptomyces TaxID=2593676 RepID=UPI0036A25645